MATNLSRSDPVLRLSTRIRGLLNAHLKDMLREENLPVSGVKQELVNRLQAHIQRLANERDMNGIQRLLAIAERGQVATSSSSPSSVYSPNAHSNGTTSSSYGLPRPSTSTPFSFPNMPGKSGDLNLPIKFKSSPFFTVKETLVSNKELRPARENTRDTIEVVLTLSSAVASQLQNDATMRVMIYSASEPLIPGYSPTDIAFPHQVELKCNLDEVKANLRGLKNKPGSTRPADITQLVRKKPGYANKIAVTYALTTKKYYLVINLVKKHTVEELVTKLKTGRVISKEQVLREMRSNAADEDIVATASVMSLKCPLSTLRMDVPTRSMHCSHNQCFDASSFLQLQEQAPTWTCPVCNKQTFFETLTVDMYVDDILKTTGRNIEQVTVEPDGVWSQHVATEPQDKPRQSGSSAYDDYDDDDDLVEIQDGPVNRMKQEYTPASSVQQTPPYGSREPSIVSAPRPSSAAPKRPASAVIDLTESDDEDVPVRPIKRPSLAPGTGSSFRDGVSFSLPRPQPPPPSANGGGYHTQSRPEYHYDPNSPHYEPSSDFF